MTQDTQTREALVEVMKKAAEEGEARYYETTPPDFADDDIKRGMIVDAQLAALEGAGVRLVPVEATDAMKVAARVRPHKKLSTTKTGDMYADVFSAMLSASPYKAKDKTNDRP